MTKKQIVLVIILIAAIAVAAAGGYVTWRYFQKDKIDAVQSASISGESSTTPQNAIGEEPNTSNLLSVDSAQNITSLGQLGGNGQTVGGSGTAGSSSAPSTSAPTPESFKDYEKYKDNNGALFGEIKAGTGAEVVAGSKVAMYYKGWLTDGTLFDQTRKDQNGTPQPFMFTVGSHEVIPGMEQGIFGMKAGGTRRIIIPPSAGYGEQGNDAVPPNSVLVFDIQLVTVQ